MKCWCDDTIIDFCISACVLWLRLLGSFLPDLGKTPSPSPGRGRAEAEEWGRKDVTLSMAIAAICILCMQSLGIGTMRKHYCTSNIHIECAVSEYGYWSIVAICNLVAAIPPHSSSRPWCHQSSFGSLCNFTPYLFCVHKEVLEEFCHNNYIREKKNSKTMTQKKIDGIKVYLKNVEGWQQPDCILLQYSNCHTVHSICILLVQYVYCLCIVPISKLCTQYAYYHSSHTECNKDNDCLNY